MAQTPSTMLPLGTPAPDFSLPAPDGTVHSLEDFAGSPALLVIFMCNHCPFVKNIREGLAAFAVDKAAEGLAVVGINSNNFEQYPDDSPQKMLEEIEQFGYTFPYLVDESQEVAQRYRAACTPDFYLFDQKRKLAYRGQFDDSRPGNGVAVTGKDLRRAVDDVLAGRQISIDQRPSVGCNIKWKPGNEPEYAR